MRDSYEKKGNQHIQAKAERKASLEETLCAALCKSTKLEVEWRRSPCGSLQCQAYEKHAIPCFVLETPRCKSLGATFTKFDHSVEEGQRVATRLLDFLEQYDRLATGHQRGDPPPSGRAPVWERSWDWDAQQSGGH